METKQKGATKDKRRNNEKRKEKSRDAARCRRSKETEMFTDLAAAVPVPQEHISQLDKASIMRLAISYLRVRDMINLVPSVSNNNKPVVDDDIKGGDDSVEFLKSLEGFLLVLSNDGDFVYLSENVSDYLGIGQIDWMGQNIYDYSHPCDHEEIKELLSTKVKDDASISQKSFFIRLKCTLTSKGRSVNLKSATYKVLHCRGHMLRPESNGNDESKKLKNCFAAIATPIPHPSNIESPLPKQTFITKHSLDMKFVHADDKIMKDVLGYNEDELLGQSVYEYHHAMDSDSICAAYKCLFSKGQCETGKYRFLAKKGGYVWVLTQATLIYDKMQKPQNVVCVNYVISGVECENEVYSAAQLSCVKNVEEQTSSTTVIDNSDVILLNESLLIADSPILQEETPDVSSISGDSKDSYEYLDEDPLKPKRNTQKILTTRTKDMSRGFLTFTEDSGLTTSESNFEHNRISELLQRSCISSKYCKNVDYIDCNGNNNETEVLKEEPEDLTHLAPVAGDVCVPLEDHPFLSDVLDDLLLRENLNPLMMDTPIDPFISYRDTYDMSPELSPNFSKSSSLPSLNSPSNSLGEDDHMSTFMNYSIEEEGSDSSMRSCSPYIPMNMDDLPLLLSSSNDLMWSNSSSPTPPSTSNKPAKDSSSLAQLLSTTVKTSIKSNTTSDQIGQSTWNTKTVDKTVKPQNSLPNCNKRTNTTSCNTTNKRMKTEQQPKDNITSELLQQLISNNNGNSRGRPKKANWLLEGQKAACISQPSDSVLMNLLGHSRDSKTPGSNLRKYLIRVNSKSLLNPETAPIASFLTLTDKDYEVNAPVNNRLLQGEDLIKALDIGDTI